MNYTIPSIPQISQYHFDLPQIKSFIGALAIGKSIKDQPNDTTTAMKQAYDKAINDAESSYNASMTDYQTKYATALKRSQAAEKEVTHPRKMKILSITALATSIIGALGVMALSIITCSWPLSFATIPFVVGAMPSGMYTNIFSKKVAELDALIKAPKLMSAPKKAIVPAYKQSKDLDLYSSRIEAINTLAQKTLREIAESEWTKSEILNYSLLDGAIHSSNANRPSFYAQAIQLLDNYRTLCEKRDTARQTNDRTFKLLTNQLYRWKSEQDSEISYKEYNLAQRESTRRRDVHQQHRQHEARPVHNFFTAMDIGLCQEDLELHKQKAARTYGRIESDIAHWYKSAKVTLESNFNLALQNIEHQYNMAKLG